MTPGGDGIWPRESLEKKEGEKNWETTLSHV